MKHSFFAILGIALFPLTACTGNYSKVEKDTQKHLDEYRERHVLALQTGEVTLPVVTTLHHIKYPQGGGRLGFENVYLVNGGFMGHMYECQGCDSCMTCYKKARLIDYEIKDRNESFVTANVELTPKGKKYLIENYVGSYPKLEKWRNENHIELVLVSKEKFELDIKKLEDGSDSYFCEAHRCLELTPFLEAIGGVDRNENTIKYPYKYKIEYDENGNAEFDRID